MGVGIAAMSGLLFSASDEMVAGRFGHALGYAAGIAIVVVFARARGKRELATFGIWMLGVPAGLRMLGEFALFDGPGGFSAFVLQLVDPVMAAWPFLFAALLIVSLLRQDVLDPVKRAELPFMKRNNTPMLPPDKNYLHVHPRRHPAEGGEAPPVGDTPQYRTDNHGGPPLA
jgi:hypothetical protein